MKKKRIEFLSIRFFSALFLVAVIGLSGCLTSARPKPHFREDTTSRPSEKFTIPLKKHTVLSKFGPRGKRFHTGIDIRGKRGGGDKILASRGGRVIRTQRLKGYGKFIIIKHSDGFLTRYAHLKKYLVKKGQKVKKGQVIGIVGKTGRATTEHLHFEILSPTGKFINPARLIY